MHERWVCNHASGDVIESARGAIASSRTGDPGIGEFEYAANRPQTQSGSSQTRKCPCLDGMSVIPSRADVVRPPRQVRFVPGRASLRPSQVPAQDSAERPLPKPGRQAWEVEE